MATTPPYLLVGEVLRPHGVRGELRIRLLTDYPERIGRLKQIFLGTDIDAADVTPYAVQGMRMNTPYGLLKLRGIDDRDDAERLRGLMVMVDMANAVPLDEGEFYLYQIIGIAVVTDAGETLGTLRDVLETGANDVYVVDSPEYGEILIPVIEQTIISTDIAARVLTVHVLDGLLPEKKSGKA
jgi:16S rRNA processing protein RimM